MPTYGMTSPSLLVATCYGGMGGEVLWIPVQRLLQGHSEIPTLPHHLKYVDGCSYQELGDGGGRGGGVITRMVWKTCTYDSSGVLCGQWVPRLPPSRMAPGIFGGSGRAIQQGQIEYKCGKTVGDYIPSISHGPPTLRGDVQAEDDGRRPVLLFPPKV